MLSRTFFAGLTVVAALAVVALATDGCIYARDPLFCNDDKPCGQEGLICDVNNDYGLGKFTCVDPDMPPMQVCDPMCDNPTPVCLPETEECVQCEEPARPCGVDRPNCTEGSCFRCASDVECQGFGFADHACDEGTGRCVICSKHEQCDSKICDRAEGVCVSPDDIIYVATPGSAMDCGAEGSPCESVAAAKANLTETRRWIHVAASATPYAENISFDANDAPLVAAIIGEAATDGGPGAIFAPANNNPVLDVNGAELTITLEGIAFEGGTDNTGIGIQCRGGAALAAERIRVRQNAGSGIQVSNASLELRNAIITGNGGPGVNGAVEIINAGGSTLIEFTTIADNVVPGIHCTESATGIRYNLIWENETANVVNGCTIAPDNRQEDPMFDDDYHLTAASTVALDQLAEGTQLSTRQDFDGDERPDPDSGRADYGADEYHAR